MSAYVNRRGDALQMFIEPKGERGRSFETTCVAYATADKLWRQDDGNTMRPVWAVFAGSAQEVSAFAENILLGHVAKSDLRPKQRDVTRMEFVRSAGYRHWSRTLSSGGAVHTFALPSLLDATPPTEDRLRLRFVAIPARAWLAQQTFDLDAARVRLDALVELLVTERRFEAHRQNDASRNYRQEIVLTDDPRTVADGRLHYLLGLGALLLHYLDARNPRPVPRDPVFGAWLVMLGRRDGPLRTEADTSYSSDGGNYDVYQSEKAGALPGFMFSPSLIGAQRRSGPWDKPVRETRDEPTMLGDWLAPEVMRWVKAGGRL